jgi:hypothetical protein
MTTKPILSPDFTMEDIRRLRTYEAEVMSKMTSKERIAYIEAGANKAIKLMADRKADRKPEEVK